MSRVDASRLLVDELLKYVTDFSENKNVIVSQLRDWEKLVLSDSLKDTSVTRAAASDAGDAYA